MEVILKSNIKGLGNALDVVKVKSGYAQNFLFPKQLASLATPRNLELLETDRSRAEAVYLKERNASEALAAKLNDISITIAAKTSEGEKLYGSVTQKEIVDKLKESGFAIERKQILLEEPVKNLGMYSVKIQLHQDINVKVKLWVISDESEKTNA